MRSVSRRIFLSRAAGTTGAVALTTTGAVGLLSTPAAAAAPVPSVAAPTSDPSGRLAALKARISKAKSRRTNGKLSSNGWEVENLVDSGGSIWTRPIVGSDATVAVRIGDVETVLVHVLRRFSYEVSTLKRGDVIGYRRPDDPSTPKNSNNASGTAVDVCPPLYPVGVKGGFFPLQLEVIRDILADCEGVVRWGGDLDPVNESHFEIAVTPSSAQLAAVADKIRGWNRDPGAGAGVAVNPRDPKRLQAAQKLMRRQHA